MGALTVAVITRPFAFEGKRRLLQADRGVEELLESVDTMIVIPNERLLNVAKDAGFFESFRIADDVLRQGVQGISDIITIPGIINRDFADVKTTMAGMGYAVMGTAHRSGPNRATEAAHAAMSSPLLEEGAIDGARGILINISGSSSLKLSEVNEASTIIQNSAHEDANIIFGAVLDESLGDEIKITVIATGFRPDLPARSDRIHQGDTPPDQTKGATGGRKTSAYGSLSTKPRFASEIAEETAPPPKQTRHAEEPQQAPPTEQAQQETAAPVVAAGSPAPTRNFAAHENAQRPRAEIEDGQLDVPAYLRRDQLS